MADSLFNLVEYLPKCILARIDKYWYPTLPIDYPASSSSFAFTEGDDKVAMIDMESKLGTEDSIISPDDIPEKEALGAYLGTYDVEGEAGELTLLSPNKLPESAVGALAYHYDSENDTWTPIEEVEVIDGYVWGTVEQFSPIAVFSLTKTIYLIPAADELPGQSGNVLVCNGIPTRIYRNVEDKMVAEAGAIVVELEDNDSVVGGSIDGTDVESTNVSVLEGAKINYLIGGSWITSKESKNHTKVVNLTVDKAEVGMLVGSGIWNCVDEVNITCTNSKVTRGMGAQQTHLKGKAANKTLADSDLGLGANQWVKKANIVAKNSEIAVLYSGGLNGHCCTLDAEMVADGCKCEYLCNGQSNGTIYNTKSTISNCEITYFNDNNRGHYGDGKVIFNGGNVIENCFIFCDNDPNVEMADVRGKIYMDIHSGDKMNLYVGSISNQEVTTADEAAKYIDTLKASRDVDITYMRNADTIIKDIIRFK